jgi:hypothetical protein
VTDGTSGCDGRVESKKGERYFAAAWLLATPGGFSWGFEIGGKSRCDAWPDWRQRIGARIFRRSKARILAGGSRLKDGPRERHAGARSFQQCPIGKGTSLTGGTTMAFDPGKRRKNF